ncbi:MAG: hypothetical protein AB7I38_15490 [Dehalococcoidia bacterium]
MVFVAVGVVLLAAFIAETAHAQVPGGGGYTPQPDRPHVDTTTQVVMTEAGATIVISVVGLSPGFPGAPGSTTIVEGPTPQCTSHPGPPSGNSSIITQQEYWANPGSVPFFVSCDNGYLGIVWVPLDAGPPDLVVQVTPDPGIDPRAIAEALFGIVPLPPITVRANPGTGLVALPSWFWVDGYDGSPLYGSEALGNTTVEVEITSQRYDWHFGDGGFVSTGSLGRPYPDESDIQHTYEQSSLVAGGQFEVRLEITFAGQFRVITEEDDGEGNIVVTVGDWEPLDPMVRSFVALYPVQQLQSVLTAGQR